MKISLLENDIKNQCLQWLKIKGVFAWRQNTGAVRRQHKGKERFIRFGEKGISDILALAPNRSGKLVAIEVKRADGKLTEDQGAFLDNVTEQGGIAIVVRSLDDLIKAFRAHFGEQWC